MSHMPSWRISDVGFLIIYFSLFKGEARELPLFNLLIFYSVYSVWFSMLDFLCLIILKINLSLFTLHIQVTTSLFIECEQSSLECKAENFYHPILLTPMKIHADSRDCNSFILPCNYLWSYFVRAIVATSILLLWVRATVFCYQVKEVTQYTSESCRCICGFNIFYSFVSCI